MRRCEKSSIVLNQDIIVLNENKNTTIIESDQIVVRLSQFDYSLNTVFENSENCYEGFMFIRT